MYRLPQNILVANFLSFFFFFLYLLILLLSCWVGREEIPCQGRKFLELEEGERHCKPFFFLDFIEY